MKLKTIIFLIFALISVRIFAACPIMAIDLIRHGDRTTDKQKLLLPKGMNRAFLLGQQLR